MLIIKNIFWIFNYEIQKEREIERERVKDLLEPPPVHGTRIIFRMNIYASDVGVPNYISLRHSIFLMSGSCDCCRSDRKHDLHLMFGLFNFLECTHRPYNINTNSAVENKYSILCRSPVNAHTNTIPFWWVFVRMPASSTISTQHSPLTPVNLIEITQIDARRVVTSASFSLASLKREASRGGCRPMTHTQTFHRFTFRCFLQSPQLATFNLVRICVVHKSIAYPLISIFNVIRQHERVQFIVCRC